MVVSELQHTLSNHVVLGIQLNRSEQFTRALVAQISFIFILTAFGCSGSVLAVLSKGYSTEYGYSTSLIPLSSECLKFLLSAFLLFLEWMREPSLKDELIVFNPSSVKYAILALMYSFLNNLTFDLMIYMDPGSMAVLTNLRIPLTAYLLHRMLSKSFSRRQVQGLWTLTLGAVISRLGSLSNGLNADISVKGYLLLSTLITLSSTAGVINEKYLKDESYGRLHWQNIQLYFFGSIFSLLIAMHRSSSGLSFRFDNFNVYAWASIMNMACMGIAVSFAIKRCDSLIRAISGILTMYVAALLSWLLFNVPISIWMLAGCTVSSTGLLFYFELV